MNGKQDPKQSELFPDEIKETEKERLTIVSDDTSEENELALLALSSIQGIGFITIRNLFNKLTGNLWKVWELGEDELLEFFRQSRIQNYNQLVRQVFNNKKELLENAKTQSNFLKNRRKTTIIFRNSTEYPKRLKKLKDAPAWLFVEGNVDLLHDEKIVAVIGTRNPTQEGINNAKKLSISLIRQGCVILSGLAEGIDEAGHQSAVDLGAPTIAVLGHGTETIFPSKTAGLRKELVEAGGTVISEYLYKDSYAKEKFVQRNRLQAALSGAVAVVEAKSKSGTAHTVRFAKNLDVPIFGIVGDIFQKPSFNELVVELDEQGKPVFEIGTQSGRDALRVYIHKLFGENYTRDWNKEYNIFKGILNEINRVAEDYDATDDDYNWLTLEIQKLKRGI